VFTAKVSSKSGWAGAKVDRAGFENIWVQSVEKSRLSGGNTDKGAEILLMQGGQSK
jgi:hypothetical protein